MKKYKILTTVTIVSLSLASGLMTYGAAEMNKQTIPIEILSIEETVVEISGQDADGKDLPIQKVRVPRGGVGRTSISKDVRKIEIGVSS